MTDAISRRAVLALSRLESKSTCSDLYGAKAVVSVEDIEALPALDVAPVVHARWKNVPHVQRSLLFFCSKCGTHSNFKTRFCPNCGARMDGEAGG